MTTAEIAEKIIEKIANNGPHVVYRTSGDIGSAPMDQIKAKRIFETHLERVIGVYDESCNSKHLIDDIEYCLINYRKPR